jgi:hypothetical protein
MLKDEIGENQHLIKKIEWTRVNQANSQWNLRTSYDSIMFLSQRLFLIYLYNNKAHDICFV